MMRITVFCLLSLGFFIYGGRVMACTDPVFRYALENWAQDNYLAVYIYENTLDEVEITALNSLMNHAGKEGSPYNIIFQSIDFSQDEGRVRNLFNGLVPKEFPVMAIWYPGQAGLSAPFWMGSLNELKSKDIFGFSERLGAGDDLISGKAIVWFIVESGDKEKDKEVRLKLRSFLDSAVVILKNDPLLYSGLKDVKDADHIFSIKTIPSSGFGEVFYSRLLTGYFRNPWDTDEQLVFPVFGRGRVLCGLVYDAFFKQNITDVITFLLGQCSCQIKAGQPGFDLLVSADWEKGFSDQSVNTIRPVMSSILPDTTSFHGFWQDQMTDMTSHRKGVFTSGILKTTGMVAGMLVIIVFFISIAILNRK